MNMFSMSLIEIISNCDLIKIKKHATNSIKWKINCVLVLVIVFISFHLGQSLRYTTKLYLKTQVKYGVHENV